MLAGYSHGLLRLEGERLSVGERDAEQQQLGLAIAPRPAFEGHLVAGLRHTLPPPLRLELTRRRTFNRPLLRGVAAAGLLRLDDEQRVRVGPACLRQRAFDRNRRLGLELRLRMMGER